MICAVLFSSHFFLETSPSFVAGDGCVVPHHFPISIQFRPLMKYFVSFLSYKVKF